MKKKLVFAAVAVALASGGMGTSALANTCTTNATGGVTCDTIDRSTSSKTLAAMASFDLGSIIASNWAQNYVSVLNYVSASTANYTGKFNPAQVENRSYDISDTTKDFGQVSYEIRYDFDLLNGAIKSISASVNRLSSYFSYQDDGSLAGISGVKIINGQSVSLNVPVPGPEAGAGLGALAMGGLAVYMKRRRRDVSNAA